MLLRDAEEDEEEEWYWYCIHACMHAYMHVSDMNVSVVPLSMM